MTISIPLIALIAIVVYVAYRNMGLRAWHVVQSCFHGAAMPCRGL